MKKLTIKLEIFDYWNISSGLSSGMDVSSLVVKKEGLPLLPGRTFKGLLKDAAMTLSKLPGPVLEPDALYSIFGIENKPWQSTKSNFFFSDLTLSSVETDEIKKYQLEPWLYNSMAFTAMEPSGKVKDRSLRKTEFTIPLTLHGSIEFPEDLETSENDKYTKIIQDSLRYIKRLGTSRTRGFGRCLFTIENEN